ncbi:uncharacterized protein EV420DRAFT_1669760 [Desarmillaria tabescens]|uniref:Uncharacterized protein n=1 Tax=Armillaria tabescens TaxID=1929756 RepID=A0AA39J9T7_ARMTA|nr:uncharacterized protein EV420DRAFT_1669760 [Desarmillaria tabescens]KAK0437439.1 hypothetical protein EV420DRAFT_1669760 [Desarmillaria tabescens]
MLPARQEQCQYCLRSFALRGLKKHETSCKRKLDEEQADMLYEQQLFRTGLAETVVTVPSGEDIAVFIDNHLSENQEHQELTFPLEAQEERVHGTSEYKLDDMRTIYHPSSGRLTRIDHFDDYRSRPAFQHAEPPIDPHPWRPFASRYDFKLAEFILDAALTEKQMKTMFRLLNPEAESNQGIKSSIRSLKEFKDHWDRAANLITPFEKSTVTVPLRGKDYTFDVYRRDLWTWALDLIQDPLLEPHFVWDAVQLSKWNGQAFERFIDEPWTAQAFWDLQTALPKGAKVLCYIIYADKTRLSSFGTAQGYPVIAHCGNLKIDIRNGNGVGGGRVVGWLPLIKEEAKFKRKVYYVDFKRRVWHAAFRFILEPLVAPSKVGGWVHLALANVDLQVFPRLPIKSCDYEEANFVVLIRGSGGLKPCVVCMVPKAEQYCLDIKYELRTSKQTQEILADAAAIPRKDARNKFLSSFGLRNIEVTESLVCVVFFELTNLNRMPFGTSKTGDPFRTLSFDRLHAYDNGLFGEHLRREIVSRIEALGVESIGQADDQIKRFPRWRNLYHFESGFMAVHFADGGKYEDLSKHILFVTHNLLTETKDKHGYHLLKCVRSYIELHMYTGFNLHTERSIQAIQNELLRFSALIREYEQLTRSINPGAKSWNFPKVHSHQHVVDDILQKGVTLNYNTKPNEKMHGPLKDAYQLFYVSIRGQIDLHDEQLQMSENDDSELKDQDKSASKYSGKVTLHGHRGKGGGVFKIGEIRALKAGDPAFKGFQTRLSSFMSMEKGSIQDIQATRRDSAIRPFERKTFPLALVRPLDEPVGTTTAKLDKDLGFYRVRARKKEKSVFVSVYMIIRGALLVEDFGAKPGDGFKEYLIVDSIDSDMFLRMKSLKYTGGRD